MAGEDVSMAVAPHEWTLKRNCSLSPRQFASLLGSLALVSLLVASVFAWSGAWWILLFSVVEVVALAIAFVAYARHAGDYERIVVGPDALVIELNSGSRLLRRQTHPALARVEYPYPDAKAGGDALIGLALGGEAVGVGRFVPLLKRESLAREIRGRLLAARSACRA